MKKFQKSTRHNHQYLRVRVKPKVYLDFPRSLKHGSSVEISAMDSLTPKTWIVKKFQKSIRHIHQYLRVRLEPEVLPRFLRLPKHGSSVEISAMDSLTSKTWIVWKFQKFTRQNHQYLSNRKLTWIFEITQTWYLSRNVGNGFLDFENINTVEIVKIYRIVLKLSSKIWVNPWNFEHTWVVFCVYLRKMASE